MDKDNKVEPTPPPALEDMINRFDLCIEEIGTLKAEENLTRYATTARLARAIHSELQRLEDRIHSLEINRRGR